MSVAKRKRSIRTPFIVAIIGAIATIAGGILAGPLIGGLLRSAPQMEQVTIRVTANNGSSVSRAKALLFFQGGLLSQFTDGNGSANFALNTSELVNQ